MTTLHHEHRNRMTRARNLIEAARPPRTLQARTNGTCTVCKRPITKRQWIRQADNGSGWAHAACATSRT